MSSPNTAAWLPAKGQKLQVGPAELHEPGPDEVLVEVKAIGLNPVDCKIQEYGFFLQTVPMILGSDVAGFVAKVGSDVAKFKPGDRVVAYCIGIKTGQPSNGAFQQYAISPADLVAVIPDSMAFKDAAVLPMGFSTASAGLYEQQHLGLPFPSLNPQDTGKTVLIWGGSSNVGSNAIQLARASGYSVVTTASKRNFGYCENLGAKKVFDHSSPTVVGDLVAELSKSDFAGAYEAVGTSNVQVVNILAQLGGGKVVSVLQFPEEGIPTTVAAKQVFGVPIGNGNIVGKTVYEKYLPQALERGLFTPMPRAKVVGEGLDSIQAGLDQLNAGVSATKLVITL